MRRRAAKTVQRQAVKEKVALKLVSCNVNRYAQREVDVENVFAHEKIHVLFVCEIYKASMNQKSYPL